MKKLLLLLLFAIPLYGQGARFEGNVVQVATIAGFTDVLTFVSTAQVTLCTYPANAVPCTNKATTYTLPTLATACSTAQQLTLPGSNSCTSSTDAFGNWGVWIPSGTFSYTITIAGVNLGPYTFSAGGTGNGGIINVTVPPSGTCSGGATNQQVISTGVIYSCQGGTWGAVGGGLSNLTPGQVPVANGSNTANGSVAPSTTVNGQTCALGASCTVGGGLSGQTPGQIPVANTATTANSSVPASTTVNGQVCALGSTCSVTSGSATAPFVSASSPSASSGTVRLANNETGTCWRNNANTADVCMTLNALNRFTYGGKYNLGDDFVPYGPNPYHDLRIDGARKQIANAAPAVPSVTITMANGANTGTISTNTCASQTPTTCFQIKDGVTIVGPGAAHAMTTPVAPTLTPVLNGVVTGVALETITAPAGAITYNAQIFEVNKFGGYTASSPTATIITSNTLGMQHVSIASCARSNNVTTCTTSAPHGLPIGCIATPSLNVNRCPTVLQNLSGMSDLSFAGEKPIQSVADNTHYTYTDNVDTRTGASTSGTGGILYWGQAVHYVLPAHTGDGMFYIACSDRVTPGVFKVVGTSWPVNFNGGITDGVLEINDWGTTMNGSSPTMPLWSIPTTCPTVASADMLTTTVTNVSGNTLTFASSAANAACAGGGCSIVIDTAPILAAIPTNAYPVFFAPDGSNSNNYYIFNSTVDFSASNAGPSLIGGWVQLNAPFMLGNSTWVGGDFFTNRDTPSFGYGSYPVITCSVKPCVWLAASNSQQVEFGRFEINMSGGGGNIAILMDGGGGGPGPYLHDLQASVGSDFTGFALLTRNGSPFHGSRINFFANNTPTDGDTFTPLVVLEGGEVRLDQINTSGRGFFTRGDLSIGFNHIQGGIEPIITTTGPSTGGNEGITLQLGWNGGIEFDTIAHAGVSNQPGLGSAQVGVQFVGSNPGGSPSSGVPLYTGAPVNIGGGTCQDPTYGGFFSNPYPCANAKFSSHIELVNTFSFFTDTLPNTVTCSVGAGGGITISSQLEFYVIPVWGNGAEGVASKISPFCPTSSGQQTVTVNWTQLPIPPPFWNIYRITAPGNGPIRIRNTGGVLATSCNSPQIAGNVTSIVLINDTPCFAPANSPAGGPTWIKDFSVATAILDLNNFADITESATPANPAAGVERVYANSTAHGLKCITSAGNNCLGLKTFNSYSANHTPNINEDGMIATATLAFTLPHAINNWGWDIVSVGGVTTLTIDSGNLYVGGAIGSITIPNSQGVHAWCDGTNCYAYGLGSGVGGGSPGGTINAVQMNNGAGGFSAANSAVANGTYIFSEHVVANASVAGAYTLPGIVINAQSGTTYVEGSGNTDFDRFYLITASNSGAQTYTLGNPSATGFGSNYGNVLFNIGTGTVTENASGFTVNGLTSLATPSLWLRWLWSNGVNYTGAVVPTLGAFPTTCTTALTIASGAFGCAGAGNVASWAGDGALYSSTPQTGTVVASLVNAGANTVWGRCTNSSGLPSYCQITDLMLTAVSHAALTNQVNTWGAFLLDLSAATLKIPTGAGCVASASAMICYDSTNKNWHIYDNNTDSIGLGIASTPANGNLASYLVVSGQVQAADSGISKVTASNIVPVNRRNCSQDAGADDGLKLQACLVALAAANSQAGIADATGLTGLTWSVNPFAAGSLPASGEIWLPPGDTVTSVPTVMPDAWVIKGIGGRSVTAQYGSNLKASASWPATYSTGTITTPLGTPGPNMAIATSGSALNTNTVVGCAFVGGTQPNVTYGIISAIGGANSITLKWGTNNGSGAVSTNTFKVFCPMIAMGGGGASNAGAQFGIQLRSMGVDCNNIAGCVDVLNWYAQQHSEIHDTSFRGFTNIGLLVEGQPQNSGPYDNINLVPGSSCTASTIPLVIRAASQSLGQFHRITATKGACATNPTVGIDVQGSFTELNTIDVEQVTTGISVGANTACPVACANSTTLPTQFHIVNAYNASGSGTTVVAVSNFSGTPTDYTLTNIQGNVTNTFTDTQNSCTETATKLGSYIVNHSGVINESTSTTSGCMNSASVLNTTTTNPTTAVGGNACSASATTVTMTGATSTMVPLFGAPSDITASTGWGSSGGLVIVAWFTTNTLNYKICNQTSGSITPGAVAWNVSVR
jgi:hypothetical protein